MSRRGAPIRWLIAPVALAVFATVGPTGPAPAAGALGEGGASSRVTRDGRIITTILAPGRRSGPTAGTPQVTWLTLTDAEVAFVMQLAASRPDLADTPLLRALEPWLSAGLADDLDILIELRGGVPTGRVRVVPAPGGPAPILARRMVTVLPALRVRTSPPPERPVPPGEPVFLSFDPDEFAAGVDRTLSAGGITARVRATPVGFQVRSGDPADVGRVVTCEGAGRAFDPTDPAPPTRQASRAGTCTVTYRTATGVHGRRPAWIGDVTVLWRAEWTVDGSSWLPLGTIPRLTLFDREVRPVDTSLEADPLRRR